MSSDDVLPVGGSAALPRLVSDHFDGKRFFNPTLPRNFSATSGAYKMMFTRWGSWPSHVENTAVPRLVETLSDNGIGVTFVNHATFLIQLAGVNILTDPMWSKRASPFRWIGPKRVREPGVRLEELPPIHLILISHNHYDHLDLKTLRWLNGRFAPKIFCAAGDRKLVQRSGLKDVRECDWWESFEINRELKITFTPTQHFSARGVFDRQRSLWGGYMIDRLGRRVYFGGDAAYSSHFSEIRKRLGTPDVALLGIGAYEPQWFMKSMHMNPAEGVRAHLDLGAKQSIGMHFGTFRMAAEGFDRPKEDLRIAMGEAGIAAGKFVTLDEGETCVQKYTL